MASNMENLNPKSYFFVKNNKTEKIKNIVL